MSNEPEVTGTATDVAVVEEVVVTDVVAEESLVEEISIDGMCGVY